MSESNAGDGVFVIPAEVQAAGKFARKTANDLSDALRSAGADVDVLLQNGWTGDAATSYDAGWRELHDGGIRVFEALADMAELLGVNVDKYVDQDSESSETFQSLNMD